MELTGFLSGAKEFISSILAVLIFLSSSFGIVNPPVEPFVPENIVEEVDNSPKMTLIDTGASAYVIVKGAAASPSEPLPAGPRSWSSSIRPKANPRCRMAAPSPPIR